MKRATKFDPSAMANKLVNDWLQQTRGLPVTSQLTKLGFAVIGGLEEAYKLGRDGQRYSWHTQAVDEAIDDEGPEGVDGPDDSGIRFDGPEAPF